MPKRLGSKLVVVRRHDLSGGKEISTVTFELLAEEIAITETRAPWDPSVLLFSATSSAPSGTGACTLQVGGETLDLGEVSRRALLKLFFPR
jgi:hypothetical protein